MQQYLLGSLAPRCVSIRRLSRFFFLQKYIKSFCSTLAAFGRSFSPFVQRCTTRLNLQKLLSTTETSQNFTGFCFTEQQSTWNRFTLWKPWQKVIADSVMKITRLFKLISLSLRKGKPAMIVWWNVRFLVYVRFFIYVQRMGKQLTWLPDQPYVANQKLVDC